MVLEVSVVGKKKMRYEVYGKHQWKIINNAEPSDCVENYNIFSRELYTLSEMFLVFYRVLEEMRINHETLTHYAY